MVVGGDTGFVHLAVALGRPVVMVGRRGMIPPFSSNGIPVRAASESIADVPLSEVSAVVERCLAQGPSPVADAARVALPRAWGGTTAAPIAGA